MVNRKEEVLERFTLDDNFDSLSPEEQWKQLKYKADILIRYFFAYNFAIDSYALNPEQYHAREVAIDYIEHIDLKEAFNEGKRLLELNTLDDSVVHENEKVSLNHIAKEVSDKASQLMYISNYQTIKIIVNKIYPNYEKNYNRAIWIANNIIEEFSEALKLILNTWIEDGDETKYPEITENMQFFNCDFFSGLQVEYFKQKNYTLYELLKVWYNLIYYNTKNFAEFKEKILESIILDKRYFVDSLTIPNAFNDMVKVFTKNYFYQSKIVVKNRTLGKEKFVFDVYGEFSDADLDFIKNLNHVIPQNENENKEIKKVSFLDKIKKIFHKEKKVTTIKARSETAIYENFSMRFVTITQKNMNKVIQDDDLKFSELQKKYGK